jgi:hypothetical protein
MARTQLRSSTRSHPATDAEREQRIRERAYLLWEADGKPHGRDVEYWERACELTGMEEPAGGGALANPQTVAARTRPGGVAKTTIKADSRKVPDGPANQGGTNTNTPPKRAARSKSRKPA